LASEECFHAHFGLKKLCNMTSSETVVSALPPSLPSLGGGGRVREVWWLRLARNEWDTAYFQLLYLNITYS
jgi:hypothetical protein